MKTLILDFSNCRYIGEVHKVIKDTFHFPDYYGENLDALWDCLDGYCNSPLHVIIKGLHTSNNEIAQYISKVLEVFSHISRENPNITFETIL